MDKLMLSLNEAAARLDVTYWTVYKLVRDGDLPATMVGRQWRVPVGALEAFAGAWERSTAKVTTMPVQTRPNVANASKRGAR